MESWMCTRVEEVLPVADSVVMRRIAEARRMSEGAMRLYACHLFTGQQKLSCMSCAPMRSSLIEESARLEYRMDVAMRQRDEL